MTEIADELIIEGVARWLSGMPGNSTLADRVAIKIAELRSELMTVNDLADFVGLCTKTVRKRHVEWGLTKSVALGEDEPRFYRSQVMAKLRSKEIKGAGEAATDKVTEFPAATPAGKRRAS